MEQVRQCAHAHYRCNSQILHSHVITLSTLNVNCTVRHCRVASIASLVLYSATYMYLCVHVYRIASIFRGGLIFAVFAVGQHPRKFNPRIIDNYVLVHAFCPGTRFHVLFDPHSAMSQAVQLTYTVIRHCSSTIDWFQENTCRNQVSL